MLSQNRRIKQELVWPIEDMDTEQFLMHMNKRHRDSMDGYRIWPQGFVGVEAAYRAFHRQLHRWLPFLNHYHGDELCR